MSSLLHARRYLRWVLLLSAAITVAFGSDPVAAQGTAATYGITGLLVDTDGDPVAFAAVALLRPDSTLVSGEVSDEYGAFAFSTPKAGDYLLRTQTIEYASQVVAVRSQVLPKGHPSEKTTASSPREHTVRIVLEPDAHNLEAATVTGRRALVELKSDRMVYNVSSSPSASGTTVLDALRGAPGVQIDLDNAIQLQGKSGVQVYINGRPTRLSGSDLAALLQSMPADNVEAIDLITNPSARYEAEGGAGIIDIRLKKNIATGINGRLFGGGSKGIYYRSSNGLSLNYGAERVRASFDLTHAYETNLFNLVETRQQSGLLIERDTYEWSESRPTTLAVGAEVQLSPKHSLSASGRGVYTPALVPVANASDISTAEGELQRVLIADTELDGDRLNLTADLGYRFEIGEDQSFSADVSLVRFDKDETNDQPNTFFGPDRTTVLLADHDAFDTRTSIALWSGKVDYEHSWEGLSLAVGAKYVDVFSDNDLDYFDIESHGSVPDHSRTNQFTYAERVAAAYASSQVRLSPAISLEAGLRMESTTSRGQLFSAQENDNRDVRRSYVDWFPNLGLSFDASGDHTWSLALGRRINRPNYQDLNPFAFPQSQLFIWQGNPFLQPRYMTNYQLSYTYKRKLSISNSYTIERDFYARVFEPLGEVVTRIIPRNMRRATSLGTTISYPQEIVSGWDVMAYGSLFYNTFEGEFEATVIDIENLNWVGRLQSTVRMPLGILLDVTASLASDWVWRGSAIIEGNPRVNLGLKRSFLANKLEVRLTGADIFRTTSDYFWSMDYGGIRANGRATFDNRRFGINASYSFGNDKVRKRRKAGALEDELDRI